MFLEDIILLIYPLAENQLKSEKESHQTDYFEGKATTIHQKRMEAKSFQNQR